MRGCGEGHIAEWCASAPSGKLGHGGRTFRARKLHAMLGEPLLDFGDVFAVARLHGAEDVDAGNIGPGRHGDAALCQGRDFPCNYGSG